MTTSTHPQTPINNGFARATHVVGLSLSLAILVIAVVGYGSVSVPLHPPRPHTYRAAVKMALDERAIAYGDVQVHNACQTNPSDCSDSWVAITTATGPVSGQITCQRYHEDCTLSLAILDIHHIIPLPPLAQNDSWLSAIKQRIQAFVRSFGSRLPL
jgi:hypothetical protein